MTSSYCGFTVMQVSLTLVPMHPTPVGAHLIIFFSYAGAEFPNLEVETDVAGRIKIHEYFADSWGIVFSHPKDFTPGASAQR